MVNSKGQRENSRKNIADIFANFYTELYKFRQFEENSTHSDDTAKDTGSNMEAKIFLQSSKVGSQIDQKIH